MTSKDPGEQVRRTVIINLTICFKHENGNKMLEFEYPLKETKQP